MRTTRTYLSSYQLAPIRLSFDFGLPTQVSFDPADGLRRFGPYDKSQPRKNPIRCAIVFPKWAKTEAERVRIGFRDGMFHFRGFNHFSRGLDIVEFQEYKLGITSGATAAEQAGEYRQSLESYKEDFTNLDLVFVVLPSSARHTTDSPYAAAKIFFGKMGIPSQMIGADLVQNKSSFRWALSNMALACYAKLGNIPWVIEDTNTSSNDLIIGFGKREFREGRYGEIRRTFGFTTAYKNNGAFVTFQGLSPTRTEESLSEQLKNAIRNAFSQYAAQQQKFGRPNMVPDRVILHSFKQIGFAETTALEKATKYVEKATSTSISYFLIHIEDSQSFYMFDSGDRAYLPEAGRVINLSRQQALLLTEGRERIKKRKIGFPHPFRVTLDKRSQRSEDDHDLVFQELLNQVFCLSRINWRGFNAVAIPVTLNYSRLLAEVAGFCQEDHDWQTIIEQKRLRDKAWFL
jgi:hypothetical protein